jgi:hypothetical protein
MPTNNERRNQNMSDEQFAGLEAAIEALCNAMPDAPDSVIAVMLLEHSPEVYEKNRTALSCWASRT